tara:strand:- start:525 stop:1712 length:1188 start_codon:yes stop_codon:yes gene_type:complete
MIFQTLDDKQQCVGVYADGKLYFDDFPENLTHTWGYSGSLRNQKIEYGYLYAHGTPLEKSCPKELIGEFEEVSRKLRAFKKSFQLAKIDLHHHCLFELIPHDFLLRFCELKNKITKAVMKNTEKPPNYDHLVACQQLLHKIKYQELLIDSRDCRPLFFSGPNRKIAHRIIQGPRHIDYNLFGTVTGRLTTYSDSFPILTMKKEFRSLIKPHNDWFLSLDYNAAEARTLLALSHQQQPDEDIHEWNIAHVFQDSTILREEAKTLFFSWLYNPESTAISTNYYNRDNVLDKHYQAGYIETPFDRRIEVESRKALNYLIQSTTSDIVLERACTIDEFLSDKESFISHIVHDEIVIDFADSDRHLVEEIRDIFSDTSLAKFMVNLQAGKNYFDLETLNI